MPEPRPRDLQYTVYLEERKLLIDAEREGARSLDKAILLLAGGAIGLSLTTLDKFDIGNWFLYAAWVSLVFSIVLTLFSFLTSQRACSRQREILDLEWKAGDAKIRDENNGWATATTWLTVFSIFSFVVGTSLLCYFAVTNLPKQERSMARKDYGFTPQKVPAKPLEKGFTPPKPPGRPIEEGFTPPKPPSQPDPKPPSVPENPPKK